MQKRLSLAQLGLGFLDSVDSQTAEDDLRLIASGARHKYLNPGDKVLLDAVDDAEYNTELRGCQKRKPTE